MPSKNYYGDAAREYQRRYNKAHPEKAMLIAAKTRAKRSNLPFDIGEEDIIIPNFCPVLGIPLFTSDGKHKSNSPSLDRVVPELGYVKGNIQVISHRANKMKNDASPEELLLFAKWINKNFNTT